ncbi:hypothetical protein JCM11251_000030 [Rhodosporidiobolus azoricus]
MARTRTQRSTASSSIAIPSTKDADTLSASSPPPPSSSPNKRKARPVEPAFERKDKKRKITGPAVGSTRPARVVPATEEEQDPRRRIGKTFKPGDGQVDYALTAPLPSRDPLTKEFTFEDWPEFKPNMSPEEIIRQGSFDGGYFRPVKSKKSGRELHEDWTDLPSEWYDGLDTSMYLTRPELVTPAEIATSINKWQAKMGQGYSDWEKNGWIVAEHDARGWFQWYCRFFLGRRCDDDARQVGRWSRVAGEQSGRWRRILLEKYRKARVTFVEPEEEEVSRGIRQTLNHWAYDPTTDHLNRFREEKGDKVANDDAGAGEG